MRVPPKGSHSQLKEKGTKPNFKIKIIVTDYHNKVIVTLKLATGIQKHVATIGPKRKPLIRKLKNPKGKKEKRSEKEIRQENEDTQRESESGKK